MNLHGLSASCPSINSDSDYITMSQVKPKTRRITQACDFCHRRGIKCRAASSACGSPLDSSTSTALTPCLTCVEYAQECTRLRQPKKRGTKPRSSSQVTSPAGLSPPESSVKRITAICTHDLGSSVSQPLCNRKIVTALLDVYLDTIHPT